MRAHRERDAVAREAFSGGVGMLLMLSWQSVYEGPLRQPGISDEESKRKCYESHAERLSRFEAQLRQAVAVQAGNSAWGW
jgi:hypothetical protein